ncbi:MAG: MmcQ/YjbR family DNA-binding protein [Paracoccus sp. (in: a-proteobacteria)]
MSGGQQLVNRICAALPGSECSDPWDIDCDCWKVGGKIFATGNIEAGSVIVKCDSADTAAMLIELGVARKAPYFHRSWVALPKDADPGELEHRIHQSYRIIRRSLTRKLQAELAPFA